ncbi:hypothetical protein ACFOD4_20035 [Pseudoroseomonas globiformis]|uniref:Secreted protein n=1 Tax=Teichococcus globiformis TaxID=2307229 RepID=A0ABV7G767_9PROT
MSQLIILLQQLLLHAAKLKPTGSTASRRGQGGPPLAKHFQLAARRCSVRATPAVRFLPRFRIVSPLSFIAMEATIRDGLSRPWSLRPKAGRQLAQQGGVHMVRGQHQE